MRLRRFRAKHKSQEAAIWTVSQSSLTKTAEVYNVPRGTAYLTSQQVLLYITYLVFYVLLARILNQTEVGEVAVLALIQALLTGLISGSLPLAATRFISRSIVGGDIQAAAGVARVTLRLSLAIALPVVVLAVLFSPYLSGFLRGAANPTNLLLVTFIRSTKSPWHCYRLGSRRYSDVTSIRLPLAWPASQRGKLSNPADFGL